MGIGEAIVWEWWGDVAPWAGSWLVLSVLSWKARVHRRLARLVAGRFAFYRSELKRRDAPSILGPNYLHLYCLVREIRPLLAGRHGRVLDVGADCSPYRRFLDPDHTYFTLDLSRDCAPAVQATATALPFGNDTLDVVICTQVAEFVQDPRELASECWRVLGPGGTLVFSAPFVWPNLPTPDVDRYRFSLGSMQRLVGSFEGASVRPAGHSWVTLVQVASRCAYVALGAAGVPVYAMLNVIGRVVDLLPGDASLSTAYVAHAVKPGSAADRPRLDVDRAA